MKTFSIKFRRNVDLQPVRTYHNILGSLEYFTVFHKTDEVFVNLSFSESFARSATEVGATFVGKNIDYFEGLMSVSQAKAISDNDVKNLQILLKKLKRYKNLLAYYKINGNMNSEYRDAKIHRINSRTTPTEFFVSFDFEEKL